MTLAQMIAIGAGIAAILCVLLSNERVSSRNRKDNHV